MARAGGRLSVYPAVVKRPKAFLDADGSVILGTGSAHSVGDPDRDEPAGKLYLPDPEQRKGWREHYVQKPAKPGARPIGFRR